MSLEYAILGLLSEKPRSGYDLKTRAFDRTLSALWPADQAQIYRTLDRLQKERMVTSTRKRQAGKPDRKVFSITDIGQGELRRWLDTAEPGAPARDPFMLQLHFGDALSDDELLGLLRSRRTVHVERLDRLHECSAELAADHSINPRAQILRQTTFDGAASRERSAIEWIDDCIAAISEGALPGDRSDGDGQRALFGNSTA